MIDLNKITIPAAIFGRFIGMVVIMGVMVTTPDASIRILSASMLLITVSDWHIEGIIHKCIEVLATELEKVRKQGVV